MITAKELYDRYEKDLAALQKICKHKESKWAEDWTMGIGHSSGRVKVCDVCWKILKRETYKYMEFGKGGKYGSSKNSKSKKRD